MKKLFTVLSILLGLTFLSTPAIAQTFDQFEDLPLTAESCFEFEVFDPILETCVIECETDSECEELENLLDELLGSIGEDFIDGSTHFHEGERTEDGLLVNYLTDGRALSDPELYDVTADLLYEQEDTATHQALWDRFLLIAPELFVKTHITQFEVFTDGLQGNMAYVVQDPTDETMWVVGIDIMDALADPKDFDYTLIHEFAHIITLESDQVPPNSRLFQANNDPGLTDDEFWSIFNEESSQCEQFFTGEGCANENSYINKFFFRFWTDIYPERLTFNPGDIEREQEFFQKYRDRFLTEYAVTNPGEDIAESFTAFVLQNRTGAVTIAEQKINFFYDYPELVDLRQQIRKNIAGTITQPAPAPEPTPTPTPTPPTEEPQPTPPTAPQSLQDAVRGRILLQVEANGEAWYVDPTNLTRYFLGRPADAFRIMRALALGITNQDLLKIKQAGSGDNASHDANFARGLAGRILLQVEGNGEAWYVHPITLERHFLGRPADAFAIMRQLGLGITTINLEQLNEGSVQ